MTDDLAQAFAEAEVWVALAEAEHAVIALEAEQGWNRPGARRPLTPQEAAAGLRVGKQWDRIHDGADVMLAATDPLAEHVTTTLAEQIATAPSVEEARARVAGYASPLAPTVLPGIGGHLDTARAAIDDHLRGVWDASAGDVEAEAVHQGVPALVEPPAIPAGMLVTLGTLAVGIATSRAARLLTIADKTARETPATTPAGLSAAVTTALRTVKPDGTRDLARQAVHSTQMAARTATVEAMITRGRVVGEIQRDRAHGRRHVRGVRAARRHRVCVVRGAVRGLPPGRRVPVVCRWPALPRRVGRRVGR